VLNENEKARKLLPKKSQKMELQIFSTAFKDGGGSEIEF
jgi:hypothetical protein